MKKENVLLFLNLNLAFFGRVGLYPGTKNIPTKCLSLNVLSSSGSPEATEYEQIRRGRRFRDPLLPF